MLSSAISNISSINASICNLLRARIGLKSPCAEKDLLHHEAYTLSFVVRRSQLFLRLICSSVCSLNFATLRCRISARASCTIRESVTPESCAAVIKKFLITRLCSIPYILSLIQLAGNPG